MSEESQFEIRKRIQHLRRSLSKLEVSSLSDKIIDRFVTHILKSKIYNRKILIGLYSALPYEVSLRNLYLQRLSPLWDVAFPRMNGLPQNSNRNEIEFIKIPRDRFLKESEIWDVNTYGIQEPKVQFSKVQRIELNIILVPGVAFGLSGERIGMGQGYYDRYLKKCPQALRIGFGFDFQLFPKLQQEVWDESLHWIITEKREWKSSFVDLWFKQWDEAE